jgi:LmbE family N-acetylglucosaminyl deacetylase
VVTRPLTARSLARSAMSRARWLVLAPHADDETLGCGALISDAAARGVFAGVVVLTNGVGSHSHDGPASRARLVATRKMEAGLAVRRLAGASAPAPVFLDWPDAEPFAAGQPGFEKARRQLAAICRARRVDALAVTARHEPHCDHEAAWQLARAVTCSCPGSLALFEYVVWAAEPPGVGFRSVRTPPMSAGRRRFALAAHRSQITPRFGPGFRLSKRMLRMPVFDLLYERIRRNARPQ